MAVIPSTWETKIRRISVLGQPGKKVHETLPTNKSGMVVHTCNPIYKGGPYRMIEVQGQSKQKAQDPI
jgi:hypothetical protein